ncbi:MAG: hemolysin III family protein [Bacilli bacterium]|nr:hemolysin III family protein [Bacilli bacterium]MDD4406815.1 hemolysin III family protein [Bacilli bacterium]
MKRTKIKDRNLPNYTKGEEIMNMVTHIIGGVIGVVALVLCVIFSCLHKDGYALAGSIVFGVSMILLYTTSSIYHGLSPEKSTAKKVFQVLDHCTIFILIAGTYTPILLTSIRTYSLSLAWSLFGILWGVAILGIIFNSIDLKRYKKFSMICYLAMGWCIVITAKDIVSILGIPAVILLLAGGIAYTVGAVLYGVGKKKKYFHSVFHIFVNIGSLLHFLCILLYII